MQNRYGYDSDEDETIEIEISKVVHETELAFLFLVDDQEIWFPKSQIIDPAEDDISVGEKDLEVTIPLWLAQEKELI